MSRFVTGIFCNIEAFARALTPASSMVFSSSRARGRPREPNAGPCERSSGAHATRGRSTSACAPRASRARRRWAPTARRMVCDRARCRAPRFAPRPRPRQRPSSLGVDPEKIARDAYAASRSELGPLKTSRQRRAALASQRTAGTCSATSAWAACVTVGSILVGTSSSLADFSS